MHTVLTAQNQSPPTAQPSRGTIKPSKIRDVNLIVPARVHVLACLVRNSFL